MLRRWRTEAYASSCNNRPSSNGQRRYLALRLAGCFADFFGATAVDFADFAGFADLAGFAGFTDLAAFDFPAWSDFSDAPGLAGVCLPALDDCREDREDPDFTGIGIAA